MDAGRVLRSTSSTSRSQPSPVGTSGPSPSGGASNYRARKAGPTKATGMLAVVVIRKRSCPGGTLVVLVAIGVAVVVPLLSHRSARSSVGMRALSTARCALRAPRPRCPFCDALLPRDVNGGDTPS